MGGYWRAPLFLLMARGALISLTFSTKSLVWSQTRNDDVLTLAQ